MPTKLLPLKCDDSENVVITREHYDALCQRLDEAEATLRAIRTGEVDALVVHGPQGDQIYTLRSADEPYRILIEQMQEAALTLSSDGAILYRNQFFAHLVGHEHPEVIGRYLSEFVASIESVGFDDLMRTALHAPVSVRAILREVSGPALPVRLSLSALRSKGFEGLCAVVTDLTQQQEKDQAVLAERLTSAVLEATSDAVLVCDDVGLIIRTNEKALRLFGPTRGQWIDGVCRLPRPFGELVQACPEAIADLEITHNADAATVYLLGGVRRLIDTELGVSGWVVTLADITRQKHMERAVRESEASFRQLAGAVPDMVWATDAAGSVEYVNNQWSEYTGTIPRGPFWVKVVHPNDRPAVRDAWRSARTGGRVVELQLRLRSARGEYRWHQVRGVPVKNDAGEVLRWLGTCSDIEDLMQAKAELERRAQQLKEADQRKDEFLAVLGHELRNPLAGIANGVALLKRGPRSPEQLEWTHNMIGDQVVQLTRLLNDLLDVARITQGKIQLQRTLLDVRPVVQAAIASARRLIDSRGHELSTLLPPEPLWVHADHVRLEQIIVNLLTNAAKYTERNGRITVAVAATAGQVCIRVRDTGVGIAADMLEHIFEPFRQLRAAGGQTDGLGIGLTLARKLIELHGGSITVTSAGPGRGSEFSVRLPQAQPADVATEPRPAETTSLPAGTRILIVDDNADSVRGLALLLEEMGCDVHTVYDGASALTAAAAYRPQVVLLDIGLPDMDGCEVAKRLRPGTDAVLVAVTGFGSAQTQRRAVEAGFNHYLVKPVDHRQLLRLCSGARASAVPAG